CQLLDSQFIHFSTNYVFSDVYDCYDESAKTAPLNFYGMTKQLGEEVVLNNIKLGLKGCILHVSTLFGRCGTSASAKSSFFDILLQAAKAQDVLKVINDEKNCFTYTKDVANQLVKMIENNQLTGIYHLTNNEPLTWYEASIMYFKLLDYPIV